MKDLRKTIGNSGEQKSCDYLLNHGFSIVERNYRTKDGEIDIIAKTGEILVFVEVKTRTTVEFGNPAEAVNETKIEHMLKTAKYFLYSNRINNKSMRFDVIEVFIYKGRYKVNHIKQIM